MKIKIPDSYELPEGTKDGDIIEELTSFRVEGEYFVPTMLAGVEIPAEDDSEESDTEENATPEEEAAASEMEKAPMRGMGRRIMGMA